jgi:flagellar biosynthesis/type III secretory pathway chaperone
MSLSTPQVEQIRTSLEAQLRQIADYTIRLEQVQQAMISNDPERITLETTAAGTLFEDIESTNNACLQCVKSMGFPSDPDGLQQLIDDQQDTALGGLKTELDTRLTELKRVITLNDILIRKNQERVRQSIRILTGHQGQAESATYTAQGAESEYSGTPRTLARA